MTDLGKIQNVDTKRVLLYTLLNITLILLGNKVRIEFCHVHNNLLYYFVIGTWKALSSFTIPLFFL